LGGVLDDAFSVKPPLYSGILKYVSIQPLEYLSKYKRLDKNLRDWNLAGLPPSIDLSATEDGNAIRKLLTFLAQPLSTTAMREIGEPLSSGASIFSTLQV
jgi:hypothetical protein